MTTQDCESLILYFVLKLNCQSEEEASPDMKAAFELASCWRLKTRWIKESECLQTDRELKGQIFVFENFAGDIFSRFIKSHTSSRVVGPRCLQTCISQKIPIPCTKYPVFNMAMQGLKICASNVSVHQKAEMKELVGFMNGEFTDCLITSNTHLVVNSILSDKYFKACEKGIQIMKKSWIEDVWKKNLVSYVEATDERIIHEYKVPIFYNLKVTASGLSEGEKNKISKIVRDNGGIYTQEMPKGTDILILPVGKGEKFKYAERWKMKCLNPSWIKCCVERGYAVPYENYIVHSAETKCSTPVNACNRMATLVSANDSDISVIPSDSARTTVGETQNNSPLTIRNPNNVFKTPVKRTPRNEYSKKGNDSVSYQTELDDIAQTDVKSCGPLLDGCKVYLAGFKDNEEEKLRKVLLHSGAIKFTELNDSVTHVVVGNPSKNELNNIKMAHHVPHIVTLDWLSKSIKNGRLEKESNCLYSLENKDDKPETSKALQQPSPLSKKGLQMLNPTRNVTANPEPVPEIDHNLIEKYSHSLTALPCEVEHRTEKSTNDNNCKDLTSDQTMPNSVNDKLFAGLKFAIVGHEPSAKNDIKRTILDFGGIVSEERTGISYTILPVTNVSQNTECAKAVTSVWMEECLNENKIMDIKYYHRPLTVPQLSSNEPSSSCVITFSSYSIYERQYLENVASFLGARCQDVLSRKENPEKNIARTTHLVCASPTGMKYKAAKKWNLPIIAETWLLDSFKRRTLLPLDNYLLREASNVPSLTEAMKKGVSDKASTEKIETKNLPHGLLVQINRETSSSIKRKAEDEISNFEAARIGSPRRKLLRPDATNMNSTSYEEVGWQDTLTDVQLENSSGSNNKTNKASVKSSSSSLSNGDLPKGSLPLNNSPNVELPRNSNTERDPRCATINLDNCEANTSSVNKKENPSAVTRKQSLRTDQLFKKNTSKARWNMMISVNNKERKKQCEAIITALGGHIIERFDPDCLENERVTHLVIDELKKTEKLLCSIASGLWIVHSSYLFKCKESGKFVDENSFEWGNPLNKILSAKELKNFSQIADAVYRWRQLIQAEGPSRRPFVGMKAVIVSSPNDESVQSLIRVVKSGGGSLIQPSEILKATHCLVTSAKNLDNLPVPMRELAAKKIHCLPAVYLSDYLMTNPPLNPERCYFDAYKRLF